MRRPVTTSVGTSGSCSNLAVCALRLTGVRLTLVAVLKTRKIGPRARPSMQNRTAPGVRGPEAPVPACKGSSKVDKL